MMKSFVSSLSSLIVSLFPLSIATLTAEPVSANNPQQQAEILLQKGLIKLENNNYQDALLDFNEAIKLNPNYAQAYFQRGRIYAQYGLGTPPQPNKLPPTCSYRNEIPVCPIDLTRKWREDQLFKALEDLEKSLALNKNYAPAYYQKGLIFESQKQSQKAIKAFQKAGRLYSLQGLNYLTGNQPQQAAEFLNYSNLSYQKVQGMPSANSSDQRLPSQADISATSQSPDRDNSPERLFQEGCQYIRIPDYARALQKYRKAARLFKESGNQKRHQETQNIIVAIEGKL